MSSGVEPAVDPAVERYAALRARHPELTYERYEIEARSDSYRFVFHLALANGPTFRPVLEIPRPAGTELPRPLLETLAFHVGLIEAVSYWKAACPPVFRIAAGALDAEQIAWWKHLWFHGLGEFFYRNGLAPDPDEFVRFEIDSDRVHAPSAVPVGEGNLVPVGGGKDSLVTLRLLEPWREQNRCFFLNATRAQEESARLCGYGPDAVIAARRTLDPALLALNRTGYLNGHTPFSALLGFIAVLTAAVHGLRRVVLSNEASASEPTVAGTQVNHQWSKSWEFERAFAAYVHRYLTPSVDYFSLLRPWSELRIVRRFAADAAALAVFRSCNVGSKDDRWCGTCPKCLFVDVLLAPFVETARRAALFGGTAPLDRPELFPVLEELAGFTPAKPFECVGTIEEVLAALTLTARQPLRSGNGRPLLIDRLAATRPTFEIAPERIEALLAPSAAPHGVPAEFAALLT
jgi:hypothetical protein